jgi:hypothetical protein
MSQSPSQPPSRGAIPPSRDDDDDGDDDDDDDDDVGARRSIVDSYVENTAMPRTVFVANTPRMDIIR